MCGAREIHALFSPLYYPPQYNSAYQRVQQEYRYHEFTANVANVDFTVLERVVQRLCRTEERRYHPYPYAEAEIHDSLNSDYLRYYQDRIPSRLPKLSRYIVHLSFRSTHLAVVEVRSG